MLASVTTLCWGGCDGETVAAIMTLTMGDIRGPGGGAICVCLIVGLKNICQPLFFRFILVSGGLQCAAVLPMRSDIKVLIAALAGA